MPYKFETQKIPMPSCKDKRIKLTSEQKDEIRELGSTISQTQLAKMFNVSKRLISFILDPSKQAENLKRRLENGGSKQYYDSQQNTISVRTHRQYKQQVLTDLK